MSAHYEEVLARLRVELYAAAQLFKDQVLVDLRTLVGEIHDLLEVDDGLYACEGCEKRFPLDDMTPSGDCYLCPECAEFAAEDARRTPALHAEPTTCTFTGKVSDCDIEDNTISCPTCGADMDEGEIEPERPALTLVEDERG